MVSHGDGLADPRPVDPPTSTVGEVARWLSGITEVELLGDPAVQLRGLTLSSTTVRPGDLYVALPGSRAHGADYATQARRSGAAAVLTDPGGASRLAGEVPVLVVPRPREVLGALSAHVYGEPARSLRMIGVTGTQGKTTTTWLAEGALAGSGVRAGVIGTVGTRIAGRDVASRLTTPEAPELHALLARMVQEGVGYCAMEVSSHSLVMGRVDGLVFDVAVFLNLGRDHLDFHADLEDYYAAKRSLFTARRARLGLVNVDDDHGRRLVHEAEVPVRTFSARGAEADWRAVEIEAGQRGSRFTLVTPAGQRVPVQVPVPGLFNVENALAAVAACAEAGADPRSVADALARGGGVPGRLERVEAGQDYLVVVDYAHKPDAVEAVLAALRPTTRGRLLMVLGAGGDRDPGKRPVMGEIAARGADVLVVTDDNPRREDPALVRAALLAGARSVPDAEVVEIGDRREAIGWALAAAGPGDVVLIAGKGHETGQEVAGVVHPFDDRTVAREVLEGLGRA